MALIETKPSLKRTQRGIYIVLLSIVCVFLLLSLALYGVGTGLLGTGKEHLTNVANVTALSALQGYIEGQGTYSQKAIAGLARANLIAQQNSIKGASGSLGGLDFSWGGAPDSQGGAGGSVTLGMWYQRQPTNGTHHCDNDQHYPCFEPNQGDPRSTASGEANAVQLRLCNQEESSPFGMPFLSAVRYKCATATASLAHRCIVFLVDISHSTTYDTHLPLALETRLFDPITWTPTTNSNQGVPRITQPLVVPGDGSTWSPHNPAKVGLPFYRKAATNVDCNDPATFNGALPYRLESLLWCSMLPQRDPGAPVDPKVHYQSDYKERSLRGYGQVMVDTLFENYDGYYAPQPFGAIFMAINSALRTLDNSRSGGDKVLLMGFNRDIIARIPASGMSSDFGFMTQITNLNNRGTTSTSGDATSNQGELHPNFLDFGLAPMLSTTGTQSPTNIQLAVEAGIQALNSEPACGATAAKTIMLFSDGYSTCARETGRVKPPEVAYTSAYSNYPWRYECASAAVSPPASGGSFDYFVTLENQARGAAYSTKDSQGRDSLATLLQKNGVNLVTVLAGDAAAPHDLSRIVPGTGRRMTQEDAYALGWGGVDQGWQSSVYTHSLFGLAHRYPGESGEPVPYYLPQPYSRPGYPRDPGGWACANYGLPGFYCGYSSYYLGPIALDSGGFHCPLRPLCKGVTPIESYSESTPCWGGCSGTDCYVEPNDNRGGPKVLNPWAWGFIGNDTFGIIRNECDLALRCSYFEQSKSQQAAQCANDVASGSPYVLVSEEPR